MAARKSPKAARTARAEQPKFLPAHKVDYSQRGWEAGLKHGPDLADVVGLVTPGGIGATATRAGAKIGQAIALRGAKAMAPKVAARMAQMEAEVSASQTIHGIEKALGPRTLARVEDYVRSKVTKAIPETKEFVRRMTKGGK